MKDDTYYTQLFRLMRLFPGSFINSSCELILHRDSNLYLNLNKVEGIESLKYRVISACSRAAYKTEPYYQPKKNTVFQDAVRGAINEFLGVDFSRDEWCLIYTYLGNDIRPELGEKFVASGFDLRLIEQVAKGG